MANVSAGPLLDISGIRLEDKHIQPAIRPSYGTSSLDGVVRLRANYFELLVSPELTLYHYNMSASKEIKGRNLKQFIRYTLNLPQYADLKKFAVTDFESNLILCQEFGEMHRLDDLEYQDEEGNGPRDKSKRFKLVFKRKRTSTGMAVSDLTPFLQSTSVNTISLTRSK